MKKMVMVAALMAAFIMPQVASADAVWYGSLRGGVQAGGGNDAAVKDVGSRWGIKGSAEISEGLSAVYNFEQGIDLANASQGEGRLSNVGLSGSFGTIAVGKVWSASHNHVGSVTDPSVTYGDSGTSGRTGSALSYSLTSGSVSGQVDLVMGDTNTGKDIDQMEFGLTVTVGDMATVGFAHVKVEDTLHSVKVSNNDYVMAKPATYSITVDEKVMSLMPVAITVDVVPHADETKKGSMYLTEDNMLAEGAMVNYDNGMYKVMGATDACDDSETSDVVEKCATTTVMAYKHVTPSTTTATKDGNTYTVAETNSVETLYFGDEDGFDMTKEVAGKAETFKNETQVDVHGSKSNHLAVAFDLGSVQTHVGYSTKKMNNESAKTKTTHFGLSGDVSEGVNLYAMGRSVKATDGMKSNPWVVGASKSLGGSAAFVIEHGNPDMAGKKAQTYMGLQVSW